MISYERFEALLSPSLSTEENEGAIPGLVWTRPALMLLFEQTTSLAASTAGHFTPRSVTCMSNYSFAQLFVTASFAVRERVHVWRPRSPALLSRLLRFFMRCLKRSKRTRFSI